MKVFVLSIQIIFVAVLTACSPSSEESTISEELTVPEKPATQAVSVVGTAVQAKLDFEEQVEEYIRLFPYQDTYKYAVGFTGGDPERLNTWVQGAEPALTKAGDDKIVRMNNDTFYKLAFVYLEDEQLLLEAAVPDQSRFVSFQLMDDRNANYRNVIFPNGEFTLYRGSKPQDARGEAIAVPSALSVIIVRVEVKDPQDAADIAAAEEIFRTITIDGPKPTALPVVDVLSKFSEEVAQEAIWRMDEALKKIPFRLTVVGPGREPGEHVPYLNHSAGTKGGWGGPATSHSSYETINFDRLQEPLQGARGTYSVTTEPPPVDSFWSLTVYDSDRGGFLHPNKYDRYHINNTSAVPNEDGTVTFLFKQDCASTDVNCLEVPPGHFDIAARYYLPSDEIRSGDWQLPLLELVVP